MPLAWHALKPYQRDRLTSFMDPEADRQGSGYQVIRALYAYGRGGILGTGLGAGLPSVGTAPSIPAIHTDFVFAAIAESNPSAGWCAFVGAGAGNVVGGFLPDAGVDTVFGGGMWPALAGVLAPTGVCTPVTGGFEVSGRWAYVSGVRHVEWICLGARRSDTPEGRMVVVPADAVEIQDDWTTCGLQGTGSNSIVVDRVVVPEWMSWNPSLPPQRGGAGTRMGIGGNFAPETAGFALGVARRAKRAGDVPDLVGLDDRVLLDRLVGDHRSGGIERPVRRGAGNLRSEQQQAG